MKHNFRLFCLIGLLSLAGFNALLAQATLRFVACGDSRDDVSTFSAMNSLINNENPGLVIHSGDLWETTAPSAWKNAITQYPNLNNLLNANKYLVSRGNHETFSEVQGITPTLVRNNSEKYSFTEGNCFFVCLGMSIDVTFAQQELSSAAAQAAQYRFVYSHYPVYSSGSGHGASGNAAFETLCDQYDVAMVFNGHDHIYERSNVIYNKAVASSSNDIPSGVRGTIYTVSGGLGAPPYSVINGNWWTKYAVSSYNYMVIDAYSDRLEVKVVNKSGAIIDQVIRRRYSGTATVTAPVVTTTAVSAIAQTSANTGGNITSNGGAAVTAAGVCYSTAINPTTANTLVSTTTTAGAYISNLSGLTAGTTYHVRAYATNSAGTSYGADVTFTTTAAATVPVVSTTAASAITSSSATTGGNISSNGGAAISAAGVCYSTIANPTTASAIVSTATTAGAYSSTLSGLSAGTVYHVRAYATNSVGTSYGADLTFTTAAAATAPVVTTTAASVVTQTSATSGGNITSNGGAAITTAGVCYSTIANPTTASAIVSTTTTAGAYSSTLSGLSAGTVYHIRAYATNSVGTSYGADLTFTTAAAATAPVVSTTAASAITATTASTGGTISSNGGAAITAAGVCYSSLANPTTANTVVSTTATSGAYSSSLSGLTAATTYHVRAYATNAVGTSYGADVMFTTTAAGNITPTVSITAPTNGAVFTAPATVTISVNAADADGSIAKVEFFQGITKLGEALSSPYSYSWAGVAAGSYTISAKATDNGGAVTTSAAVGITVNSSTPPAVIVVSKRTATGMDDVEEVASGSIYTNSSDIELVNDGATYGNQTVGLRFTTLNIPKGATITKAYIQFTCDEIKSGATTVTIKGEASDNATAFTTAVKNVSNRLKTSAGVSWTISAWNTVGLAGTAERTPELKSIVQEIVNRAGFSTSSALSFIITGTGTRTARSYEGVPTQAALLYIEYSTAPAAPTAKLAGESQVDVKEGTDNAAFSLYPNPASGELNVVLNGKPSIIRVYNLEGKCILYTSTSNTTELLNVGHLENGLYILEVQQEKELTRFKLLKN